MVPWSQSASMIIRYGQRYCNWNSLNDVFCFDNASDLDFDAEFSDFSSLTMKYCNIATTTKTADSINIVLDDHIGQPTDSKI